MTLIAILIIGSIGMGSFETNFILEQKIIAPPKDSFLVQESASYPIPKIFKSFNPVSLEYFSQVPPEVRQKIKLEGKKDRPGNAHIIQRDIEESIQADVKKSIRDDIKNEIINDIKIQIRQEIFDSIKPAGGGGAPR